MLCTTRKEPQRKPLVRASLPIWGFVKDLKKGTQSVSVQEIVNYDPSCPSQILIEDLKKVSSSFAEGLDNMDIVNAPQSTCSKAEVFLDRWHF